MVTIDGPNKIITLETGVTNVNIQDVYSDWKIWVGESDNSKYLTAFDTVGGDPLTPGINAGAYFFLRNDLGWRIKPPEENITIYMNGNLTPKDSSLPILITTTGDFRVLIAGIQPITQAVDTLLTLQQTANYRGKIAIDMYDGVAGTTYPVGTDFAPVNNFEDARTIAESIGLDEYTLHGSIVLNNNFIFSELWGHGQGSTVNINSQDIAGSYFYALSLSGSIIPNLTGATFENCYLYRVNNLNGNLKECSIDGKVCFNTGSHTLSYCMAGVNGAELCLKGLNSNLILRNWSGPLTLTSGTSPNSQIVIDSFSSIITLDSSIISGNITLYGVGDVVNNMTGNAVLNTSLLQSIQQARIENKIDDLTALSL